MGFRTGRSSRRRSATLGARGVGDLRQVLLLSADGSMHESRPCRAAGGLHDVRSDRDCSLIAEFDALNSRRCG
jgi:hypothetical protein